MKRLVISGFAICESNFDDCGNSRELYVVGNEDLAKLLCFKNTFYSYQTVKDEIIIFDTLQEIEEFEHKSLSETALAKLTVEERMVLGLS